MRGTRSKNNDRQRKFQTISIFAVPNAIFIYTIENIKPQQDYGSTLFRQLPLLSILPTYDQKTVRELWLERLQIM